jgi:toxin YoeB
VILVWSEAAWADYLHWQANDPKLVRKINTFLEDIARSPFRGLGKPEPLKEDRSGFWSRRLSEEHRLVYRVLGKGTDQRIEIAQCRFHY